MLMLLIMLQTDSEIGNLQVYNNNIYNLPNVGNTSTITDTPIY